MIATITITAVALAFMLSTAIAAMLRAGDRPSLAPVPARRRSTRR